MCLLSKCLRFTQNGQRGKRKYIEIFYLEGVFFFFFNNPFSSLCEEFRPLRAILFVMKEMLYF